ncbi:MAG TPA: molybdenum cofactor biosynthesis protein MoaE [Candidatus Limnocylindria bacterium]|nr:molybdenum cofactor biosynthesis protein MoaE [Candidatus Limnocylindria bacterium]
MQIKVRLFAILRQQAGWREKTIELAHGSTIDDAWRALAAETPAIAASREIVRFARNREYTSADTRLEDGDELVLIPPVAGGSADKLLRVEIREEPFDDDLITELRSIVPTNADGAVVVFIGQTRESPGTPAPGEEAAAELHKGEQVDRLEYEAFEEMALDVLRAIGQEIADRFGVTRLAIVHRTGAVEVGQASVVIVAAAAHRGAAFDAARYAIEELKARAPIWKAEHFSSGSVWLGAPAREGPV